MLSGARKGGADTITIVIDVSKCDGGCRVIESVSLSDEQERIVKSLLWDCDLSPGDFYQVLKGRKEKAGFFTRETAVKRLIEYQNWYNVLKILSLAEIGSVWNEGLRSSVRGRQIAEGIDFAVRISRNKTLPISR